MRQDEFLNSLKDALVGKVPEQVIYDNINYYTDYINSQIKNGRSESDILASLGDPRLLAKTIELIATKGYVVGNIDCTICAERPKMNPHIPAMKECIAKIMNTDVDNISIKATTTDKLGFTGREEGISAYATVLINKV